MGRIVVIAAVLAALGFGVNSATAAPVNDNLADATPLTGSATDSVFTGAATEEVGEPDHAGNSGGLSAWWSWSDPVGGSLTVTTAGSNYNTLLAVYKIPSGKTVEPKNLSVEVSNNDISSTDKTSSVNFTAASGVTYYIAIDGHNGVGGTAVVNTSFVQGPPANDNFAKATVLTGGLATGTADITQATAESLEQSPTGFSTLNTVWWRWKAPAAGDVTIETVGSVDANGAVLDTLMTVYTTTNESAPTLSNLNVVASATDISSLNRNSRILLTGSKAAVQGVTYFIQVSSFNAAPGTVTLSVMLEGQGPANNLFSAPAVLTGSSTSATGTNVDAVKEIGEPSHAGNAGGASAWWAWTAPFTGTAAVDTVGSDFTTLLAVYTGDSVTALTSVASNTNLSNSSVTFTATKNQAYRIAVDGLSGATGNITLNLSLTVLPNNDVVLNLGQPIGVWALLSGSAWTKLNNADPGKILVADVDGSGNGVVIADFGAPFGLWVRSTAGVWTQYNINTTTYLVGGDLDGNGQTDVIADFGAGVGSWVKMNDAAWVPLNVNTSSGIVTGDLDGGGLDEAIVDLGPVHGVWVKTNNDVWSNLHASTAKHMAVGDLDGTGMAEAILDLDSEGIWIKRNNGAWEQIHTATSEGLITGDLDGDGKAELIADLGTGSGLWVYRDTTATWSRIDPLSPGAMAMGDQDSNGKADLVADFGAGVGTRIYRNDTAWETFNVNPSSVIAIGSIDGS